MQTRGLSLPVFEDERTSFLVRFYQKIQIEKPLADEEQRILAYAKEHSFIRRVEAQELLNVNEARARYPVAEADEGTLLIAVIPINFH